MSTYTVTNGNDSGAGSLRDAINLANSNPGSTIVFDNSVTKVQLTSGTLTINSSTKMIGNGTSNTEITCAGNFCVVTISGNNIELSKLTISNGNSGSFGFGGGINSMSSSFKLEYVVLKNNAAARGGGIYCDNTNAEINYCTFINNTASLYTAGIQIANSSTVNLNYCSINGNLGGSYGGGVGVFNSVLNLKYSTVSSNTASGYGAGICSSSSSIYSFNNTFALNIVNTYGGSIYATSSNITLINTTNSGNGAFRGGGIYILNSAITINNTLIAKNTSRNSYPDVYINTPLVESNNNLIGIDDSGTFVNGINGNKVGSTVSPLNPRIGPLQNNGGFTETMALDKGSYAINSGNNSLIPVGELYDQRGVGFLRIANEIVDIGAYEYQGIVCYAGKSMILVKNILTDEICEMEASNVKSGMHLVFDTENNCFTPVKLNIVTGMIERFMLIKKNILGSNLPNADFYVTSGHKIIVNGKETKARKVPGAVRVKVNPQKIYSICTENRCPILINGLSVISWGYDEWIDYATKMGINWTNNGQIVSPRIKN